VQLSPDTLSLIAPFALIALFAILWSAFGFFTSYISGWLLLSRSFTSGTLPQGDTQTAGPFLTRIYLRFWAQYGGVTRLTTVEDGLYLSVVLLFRVGHPPLRIPWNEISVGRTRYMFQRFVVLTLGRRQQIPMRITDSMALKLGILDRFPSAGTSSEEPKFKSYVTSRLKEPE